MLSSSVPRSRACCVASQGVHPLHAVHTLHVPIGQAVVLPQDLQGPVRSTGVQGSRRAELFTAGHCLTQQGSCMTCKGNRPSTVRQSAIRQTGVVPQGLDAQLPFDSRSHHAS